MMFQGVDELDIDYRNPAEIDPDIEEIYEDGFKNGQEYERNKINNLLIKFKQLIDLNINDIKELINKEK